MPVLGRRLDSYPIPPDARLDFDGRDPATIRVGTDRKKRLVFERIEDGQTVYRLLRQVQSGEA